MSRNGASPGRANEEEAQPSKRNILNIFKELIEGFAVKVYLAVVVTIYAFVMMIVHVLLYIEWHRR